MTAAVPDPRFRDQLAVEMSPLDWLVLRVMEPHVGHTTSRLADLTIQPHPDVQQAVIRLDQMGYIERGTGGWHLAAPPPTAEVEARVQAAANQRAAEADALRHNLRELCDSAADGYVPVAWLRELRDRAAAPAPPAPAPRAEEGQR